MIVLFRVDDRLIHGQVTTGWGPSLHPDAMVVIDDDVAECDWECDLYRAGVPEGVSGHFITVDQALAQWNDLTAQSDRAVILVRSLQTVQRLLNGGAKFVEVNLGGLHHRQNTKRICRFIHLDSDDIAILNRLNDNGIALDGRDVPGTVRENLSAVFDLGADDIE